MIDCRTARRMLDEGLLPGPATPERAQLGFHLAGCPVCRAYRTNPEQVLLGELLSQPPPERFRRRRPPNAALRYVAVALIGLLLVGAMAVGPTALALVTIQQNYAVMQVPATVRPSGGLPLPTPIPDTALLLPYPATDRLPEPVAAAPAEPATLPGAATAMADVPVEVLPDAASADAEAPVEPSPSPGVAGAEAVVSGAQAVTEPLEAEDAAQQPSPELLPSPTAGNRWLNRTRELPTLMPTAFPTPLGTHALTVLLLGIDQRPDETYPARADAIAIVRIDPDRSRVAMLSLPRALIVNIPGHGYGRINSASVVGELNPGLGGGVELTRQTVSQLLGVPIDYVVHANFMGFIGAVDAIGGVEITVDRELYDPQYPTMDYGYTVAHFLPGLQHMDGATALMYGRVRHMDSDYERMRRQQQVLVAALDRVRAQNPLEQVQSVAAVTTALRGFVQTDLPQEQLIGLAWTFRHFDPAAVERYVLDGSMISEGVIAGDPYAQLPLPGAVESLAQQLMYGPIQ